MGDTNKAHRDLATLLGIPDEELHSKIADKATERIAELLAVIKNQNKIAAATAHRACCGSEHDPENGKLHGYCVVCGIPWPCETAKEFLFLVAQEDSDHG